MASTTALLPHEFERPVLDLSADALRAGLQIMIKGSENHGGIEQYIDAVKLKSTMFRQALVENDVAELDLETFKGLCTFMATVRRRISEWLNEERFVEMHCGIVELFKHRWVRDLAVELLHNADPERVPMMNRWIWDVKANTGVIREIWHGDDVDHMTIQVADNYGTYVMLREELSQFLSENGFFRDVLFYVDVLCAQIYAQYICEQGGSYLRTDFSAPEDPMQHTRRLLGLDGVQPGNGRTRLKSIDGEAFILDDSKTLN
jgi:hypothetical protein